MQEQLRVARTAISYLDLRRRVLFFAVAFSILVLVAGAILGLLSRSSALEAAERRAQSYSHILSDHLQRTIGSIDARLAQIALQSARLGGPEGDAAPWREVLDAARGGAGIIGSLSVADRRGVIRHSTIRDLVGQGRGDRFIMRALATQDAPELLSDSPIRSPFTGDLLLPFGRRLVSSSGAMQGAVVATFRIEALRSFYTAVETERGSVRVIHTTGAVVLQEPAGEAANGVLSDADPVLSAYRSGRESGVLRGPLADGGPRMITSFAAVGRTGLLIAVSLNEGRALSAWSADVAAATAVIIAVLTAFWAAVGLMLEQFRARERVETALLEQRERSAEKQRLESIGQLTGGVAHDFNNLLTVIINAADSLFSRVAEDLRPRVQAILHAADNGAALVRQLLAFSRQQALQFAPVDLNAVVASMQDMLRRTLGARVEIEFALAPALWRAYADRAQVESALLNLAINARDAMPEGGKLTVETHNAHLDEAYAQRNTDVQAGDYVALAVTDTGIGMAADVLEKAIEPFFTTKEVGKGTGLGLSMIYGFARQSSGHLKIYSEVGLGTTVRLYLPRDAGEASHDFPATAGSDEDRGGDETILVAEDDAQVRALATASLRERGYNVLEAANGAEALALLRSGADPHLLLTDIIMPGAMTGRDLAEEALRLRPGLKVLFTSGYADASIMRNGLVRAGARFLAKPYRGRDLAAVVRALLDHP